MSYWLSGSKDGLIKIVPMANSMWVTLKPFMKGSLIRYLLMTNRSWVTLHILWKAVWSDLFLWPTACEWHCTLWKAVSSHPFLWPTGSEWHCTFCERQSDHLFSYDQQGVSDIAHFVKGSLITSFPLTNRLWVDIAHFVKGSLITSFPMTNRLWVTLHILWKAVWSDLFLWPTVCEWHCTFCERQSHHIFSYDQQVVSDIAHFVKGSLITSFPMTNSLWVTFHILWKAVWSHLCPLTNRLWVTLHILSKKVWWHLFLE